MATHLPIAQVLLFVEPRQVQLSYGEATRNPKSLTKRLAFEQLRAWCNSKARFGK